MALLTRHEIQHAADVQTKDIPVPEWGGEVRLRALTGFFRDEWSKFLVNSREGNVFTGENVSAKLVSLSIVGEDGKLVFNDPDGVKQLGRRDGAVLDRLAAEVRKLSKLGRDEVEAAEKN